MEQEGIIKSLISEATGGGAEIQGMRGPIQNVILGIPLTYAVKCIFFKRIFIYLNNQ